MRCKIGAFVFYLLKRFRAALRQASESAFLSVMESALGRGSLMKAGEEGILEDLILAAHADAKGKAEAEAGQQMQELTAGLPLPPGMKLPF